MAAAGPKVHIRWQARCRLEKLCSRGRQKILTSFNNYRELRLGGVLVWIQTQMFCPEGVEEADCQLTAEHVALGAREPGLGYNDPNCPFAGSPRCNPSPPNIR